MLDKAKLRDFAPGEGFAAGAFKQDFDDAGWLDVAVPGDVHRTLIDAGRIPDPFYDRNEGQCAWIEDREWWYRTSFDGPEGPVHADERLRLVFHGLDTFATVWLNGEEIGRHENMFREAAFDVTDRLKTGEPNTLALCFHRPLDNAVPGPSEQWGRNPERVGMRKAQFGYGWDWGPRLPTVGIWRPVELRREKRAAVRGVHAYTLELSSDHRRALLAVKVEAERLVPNASPTAGIALRHPRSGETLEKTVGLHGEERTLAGTAYLEVENPALWWTHDLGDPALYDLRVALDEDGEELDVQESKVGIRTIELDQSPDPEEPGTRFFRFVLNGVPIFARGADWIPADSFVGAIPPERYENLIGAAREANMNMLRIWGGGIYEHDAYYDLCDSSGILVWQDFMFACATYPEGPPEFVAEVEAEARYQVSRLRSRPCLALWCGNNENQWIHDRGHPEKKNNRVPGALYYHEVLPRVVAEIDGRTPYWPGSPFGGDDHNDRRQGNVHNWEVWHGNRPFGRRFGQENGRDNSPEGVSYLNYAKDTGRFISEFGMHAAPVLETLRRVIPEDQLYHHSPSMDHHNKDDPKNKGDDLMLSVTGLPGDLDEYVDFSMISQAEGLKFALEHFRRRKPHCSGTLFWQLNDCWPVLSWSVVDHNGFGKAGYYYAKRAYAPVLASFKEQEDGGVELWISNDTLEEIEDQVLVKLGDFDGETLWEESLPVRVPANASAPVASWEAGRIDRSPSRYVSAFSSTGAFPKNRLFFAPIKDLRRRPEEPETSIEPVGVHGLRVTLRAMSYAYFVHLAVPDEATRFSDNYFDLEPGEERTVVVKNEKKNLTPEMVEVDWR